MTVPLMADHHSHSSATGLRAVVLNRGRIVADGPTRAILSDRDLMAANRLELPYGFDPSIVG